jgi:hypothetical protein
MRLVDSKLFENDRMRLGALPFAIENGVWTEDIIKLAVGINRRELIGLPWFVSDMVGFAGGLMVPADHPFTVEELQNMLNLAVIDMEPTFRTLNS